MEKFFDHRWKNKRTSSKRKVESNPENASKKKCKVEKMPPKNSSSSQEKKEISISSTLPKFRNIILNPKQFLVLKDQQKEATHKICIEGDKFKDKHLATLVSPCFSSCESSFHQRNDLPYRLFDVKQIDHIKSKKQLVLGDFKSPFDVEKLSKHNLDPLCSEKENWINYIHKFTLCPTLCKSKPFLIEKDLSRFTVSLFLFTEKMFSVQKRFDQIVLKESQSSSFQVLNIFSDLYLLLEKLYSLRKEIKESLSKFENLHCVSEILLEENKTRLGATEKVKHYFEYLSLQENLLNKSFFFEENLSNFAHCGSSLLVKQNCVEVLSNFEEIGEIKVSPVRFYHDLITKTSSEIGNVIRNFLSPRSDSSLFISLRFIAPNIQQNFQLYLSGIEFNFQNNFLPLSFLSSPPLHSNQMLLLSHHFEKGNLVDNLLFKFPFHLPSFPPHILSAHINQVLFLPQQNLTKIDYSLVLDSERNISSSASSFKQILTSILN